LSAVGDYEGALARLTEMTYLLQDHVSLLSSATSQHVGIFADVLTSCEILRVFLLLLLQVVSLVLCIRCRSFHVACVQLLESAHSCTLHSTVTHASRCVGTASQLQKLVEMTECF